MEDEGSIGLVLARATELRLKIGNCVHKATAPRKLGLENGGEQDDALEEEEEGEEVAEEAQRLVTICDALESLESQLSSLQCLQQQPRYEREVALGEIEQSRKSLLDKLNEYKGEALEVINEASAFAAETVERNNDLLLPPYPSRPLHTLRRDNGYSSHKLIRNGAVSENQVNGDKKKTSSDNPRGLGSFLGAAAKTLFTAVGVVSVLSLSGFFGPKLANRERSPLKIVGLIRRQTGEGKRSAADCPPGKILVVENGEARCLVKERVEVPFSSAATKPDVNYGCG